jgi:hypothetical protein
MSSGSIPTRDELHQEVAQVGRTDRAVGNRQEAVLLCGPRPKALLDQVLSPALEHERKMFDLEDAAVESDGCQVVLGARVEKS